MRSHCAIYVDVGYLLAAAATRATGTSLRRGVQVDHPELIRGLIERAESDSGLPLLRVNWYDSGARPGGMPDFVQDEIGLLPRVKLRLGRLSHAGEQKGVDLRIGLDLATHGRNRVVDVIYLVSGDDDLTEAVEEAQGHGVQVILLAVPGQDDRPHGVARHLQRAADGLILLDGETIDRAVRTRAIPEVLIPDEHKPDSDEPTTVGAQPHQTQPDQTHPHQSEADPTPTGAPAGSSVDGSGTAAPVLDGAAADASVAGSMPKGSETDASVPDASVPEFAETESAETDAPVPDASVPDAAAPDAPVPDAPVPDAAVPAGTGLPDAAEDAAEDARPPGGAEREAAPVDPASTTRSREAVAPHATAPRHGAQTRPHDTDGGPLRTGPPDSAPAPSPTPSLFAKKKATALVPPPEPVWTSATGAGGSGAPAEAGIDLEVIDLVARQVIRSWCTTATPQLLAELKEQRPSIPGDLDRAMLVDLSNRSGHYDIDEGSRHELRSRFWHLVDQIRLS
jgi:uncharacterized LabA/DUF88 family protein